VRDRKSLLQELSFFHAAFRHNGYSEGQKGQALNPNSKSCTRVSCIYYC